jgi:hypothetical protein
VTHTLVGDVANVIWIETLRPTPLIVDWSWKAKPSLDRTFSLRPRLINSSPAKLDVINPLEDQFNCAARDS